jgi:hypothetical protein
VDFVEAFDTLEDYGVIMTNFHITPAIFNNNRRNKTEFQSIDFLCFDFDDGTLSQKIHTDSVAKHWNHLIVGSKNHMKDKNDGKGVIERFHLFIPLQQPIKDAELYKYSVIKLGEILEWSMDKNATDCSRYFYKHSQVLYCEEKLNNLNGDWLVGLKRLDDEKNNRKKMLQQRAYESKRTNKNYTALQIFERTTAYRELVNGDLSSDGNRYALSNHIIGVALKCGMNEGDISFLFEKYATYGESFTRESVHERIQKWS